MQTRACRAAFHGTYIRMLSRLARHEAFQQLADLTEADKVRVLRLHRVREQRAQLEDIVRQLVVPRLGL